MASRFYTSIDINGTLQLYIMYCMCKSHLDNRHYVLGLIVCIMCITHKWICYLQCTCHDISVINMKKVRNSKLS